MDGNDGPLGFAGGCPLLDSGIDVLGACPGAAGDVGCEGAGSGCLLRRSGSGRPGAQRRTRLEAGGLSARHIPADFGLAHCCRYAKNIMTAWQSV
jgi:hypothetical protein